MPLSSNVAIFVKRLDNGDLPLPRYMTESSAGMDIFAAVDGETTLLPGDRALIPTGIAVALPVGYEAQIRPRSGLAMKAGITLLNSPGTIDADYRGEIKILLINHGLESFTVKRGDRIAQMVINEICRASWEVTEDLEETVRGSGGFGHTG